MPVPFESSSDTIDVPRLVPERVGMISALGGWILVALALLEPLSRWVFRGVAMPLAWVWLALGIATVGFALSLLVTRTVIALRERSLAPLAGAGAAVFCALFGISDYSHCGINFESAQQMTAGMRALHTAGLGYHELEFLLYPARQYTFAALPAALLGPSLLTLRLGYSLCFLAGWACFQHGLSRALEKRGLARKTAVEIGTLVALLVLTCPLAIHWIRAFEQTLLPLSLCMLTFGAALCWWTHRSFAWLLAFGWAAGMLGTSYSPALAAWALVVAATLILAIAGKRLADLDNTSRFSLASAGAYVLACGVTSVIPMAEILGQRFSLRGDTSAEPPLSLHEIVSRIAEGFSSMYTDARTPFLIPFLIWPLVGLVVKVVITPRIRSNGYVLGLAAWTFCTIASAVTLHGYVRHAPSFDLHRALVVLPVLLACLAAAGAAWGSRWPESARVGVAWLLAAASVHLVVTTKDTWGGERYQPRIGEDMVAETEKFLRATGGLGTICVDSTLEVGGSLGCFVYFFSKEANCVFTSNLRAELPQFKNRPLLIFLAPESASTIELRARGVPLTTLEGISARNLRTFDILLARIPDPSKLSETSLSANR